MFLAEERVTQGIVVYAAGAGLRPFGLFWLSRSMGPISARVYRGLAPVYLQFVDARVAVFTFVERNSHPTAHGRARTGNTVGARALPCRSHACRRHSTKGHRCPGRNRRREDTENRWPHGPILSRRIVFRGPPRISSTRPEIDLAQEGSPSLINCARFPQGRRSKCGIRCCSYPSSKDEAFASAPPPSAS